MLRRSQEHGIAASNDNCVFVVRSQATVFGSERPAVTIEAHAAVPGGDHGLDRDYQAFGQLGACGAIGIVRDRGKFVNGASHAMTAELPYHGKARPANFLFDRAADFAHTIARAGNVDSLPERALGATRQIAGRIRDRRNIDRHCGVSVKTILLSYQVQLDQVTRLDNADTRNAVHDFIIDADANVGRVPVDQGRSGMRAAFLQNTRANAVQLRGRDARAQVLRHDAQCACDDATDGSQFLKLGTGFNRHSCSFYETARAARSGMVYCPLMRIAVIGLGFMGSTHLKAWKNISEAEIFAVVSHDEKKLAGDMSDIQGNIGGPGEKMDFSRVRKYRTSEEALADPQIEAVDICLPTDQHASVTLAALRAGKHVLVEKPMALDGAGADEMLAEARKSGRVLMTGQVLRFIGAYRKTAERVKSGALGAVRAALFRRRCAAPAWSKWLADPARSGGGVFDLLIHDVDYCVHVLGKPEAVSATGYEKLAHGIDVITAQFHYPSIGSVVITGGWHHPKSYPFSMEFTVVGDQGTLDYSSEGRPLSLYDANGEKHVIDSAETDLFTEELKYFADCVVHGKTPELCPPEESAVAVRLTRWMVESRKNNGVKIACNF